MKINIVMVTMIVLGTQCGSGKPAYNAKTVIAYAKTLDVRTLDPALPSEQLDRWLREGPSQLDVVVWRLREDCDVKRTHLKEPKGGWPLCVKFNFKRNDGVFGWGILTVGTLRKGIDGAPRFEDASAITTGRRIEADGAKKLSELPSMIERLAALAAQEQ